MESLVEAYTNLKSSSPAFNPAQAVGFRKFFFTFNT
jgi:hypothetical protein